MTTTASAAEAHFRAIAPRYMRLFMQDFDASELDAAAVFGNAGYESLGFTKLQEIKPVVAGSRGGYGWFQWTGPRRRAFEAYCKRNGLNPSDDEANYKFLFVELIGSEKASLAKLKAAKTLDEKVIAFENAFERAGVKAYPKRQKWAAIALDALRTSEVHADPPPAPADWDAPKSSPPIPAASPGWLPLIAIFALAVLVGLWVWLGGGPIDVEPSFSHMLGDAPVPADRSFALSGPRNSLWGDIALQIALSFIAPLVSAAATAVVGWIAYQWQRLLKADFDAKSAAQLHAALERGILAAIEHFGPRADRNMLVASAADYAQTWNGGTVKRFGLTHDDLKELAVPHLAAVTKVAK